MTLEIYGDDATFLIEPRRSFARAARRVTVVDLFSGCGGMTLGIQAAASHRRCRLEVRLAAEIDANVRGVFADNFSVEQARMSAAVEASFDRPVGRGLSALESKTLKLVGRELDFLVGGPPCQGHSTLNNHTRGDDPKNTLYMRMVRAAEVLEPSVVLIENVPAIERDSGRIVESARRRLEHLGYSIDTAVVSLDALGVPQRRRRHVLLAVLQGASNLERLLSDGAVDVPRDVRWAIGDLVEEPGHLFDGAARLSADNLRRARYLRAAGLYDLPNRMRPACQRGSHKYKSMYGRLRWSEPAQTITSGFGSPGQGRYLHPEALRTLTPHEAARLQFFPDWFDFRRIRYRRHLARVIGNAVPPKLAFVVAHHWLAQGGRALATLPPRDRRTNAFTEPQVAAGRR